MSSFSSKHSCSVIALVLLVACAPKRDAGFDRTPLAPLDPTEFLPRQPVNLAAEDELLQSFFEEPESPAALVGACSWIDAYSVPAPREPRFRMAQDTVLRLQGGTIEVHGNAAAGTRKRSLENSRNLESLREHLTAKEVDEIQAAIGRGKSIDTIRLLQDGDDRGPHVTIDRDAPGRNRPIRTLFDKQEATELTTFAGRVDIAGNAIYQLGLIRGLESKGIPNRDEALAQLEVELRQKNFFVVQPFERLKKLILGTGLVDFYKIRNDIIAEQIFGSLPGVFDSVATSVNVPVYRFKDDTITDIVFRNALGEEVLAYPQSFDSPDTVKRKIEDLRRALRGYEKPLPLFVGDTWASYENDTRQSINVALKGLLSGSPAEQVCGAALINRTLSQMMNFMGFVRPAMIQENENLSSRLPKVGDMLDHPEGKNILGCPIPGIFTKKGVRRLLSPEELGNTDSEFDLPGRIPEFPNCDPSLAVAKNSWDFLHFKRFHVDSVATSDDWLGLLRSVSQFVSAMNPGAAWWRGDRAWPLMDIVDLNQAAESEGVIPYEAHALALGIINLGVGQIQRKHLVLMDGFGKEIDSANPTGARAVRISREARKPMSGGRVTTTLYSATLLAEAAFKFGVSFKKLAEWKVGAEATRKELAYETDKDKRDEMILSYNNLIKGLFGGEATLTMLTEETSPIAGEQSARELISDLQLASAVLLTGYMKATPSGRYTCYNEIVNDFDANTEAKTGACDAKLERRVKNLMRIISKTYGSPLFGRYAE